MTGHKSSCQVYVSHSLAGHKSFLKLWLLDVMDILTSDVMDSHKVQCVVEDRQPSIVGWTHLLCRHS